MFKLFLSEHGKPRTKHQRITVFYNPSTNAVARHETHDIRSSKIRHEIRQKRWNDAY